MDYRLSIGIESYHRITDWFGWEGILQNIQFQHNTMGRGHFPVDQVAPSPDQSALECLQGWDIQNWIYFCCQTGSTSRQCCCVLLGLQVLPGAANGH